MRQFETAGRVEWVGDLGRIFAQSPAIEPRPCAAMMGILTKGFGADPSNPRYSYVLQPDSNG